MKVRRKIFLIIFLVILTISVFACYLVNDSCMRMFGDCQIAYPEYCKAFNGFEYVILSRSCQYLYPGLCSAVDIGQSKMQEICYFILCPTDGCDYESEEENGK